MQPPKFTWTVHADESTAPVEVQELLELGHATHSALAGKKRLIDEAELLMQRKWIEAFSSKGVYVFNSWSLVSDSVERERIDHRSFQGGSYRFANYDRVLLEKVNTERGTIYYKNPTSRIERSFIYDLVYSNFYDLAIKTESRGKNALGISTRQIVEDTGLPRIQVAQDLAHWRKDFQKSEYERDKEKIESEVIELTRKCQRGWLAFTAKYTKGLRSRTHRIPTGWSHTTDPEAKHFVEMITHTLEIVNMSLPSASRAELYGTFDALQTTLDKIFEKIQEDGRGIELQGAFNGLLTTMNNLLGKMQENGRESKKA